MKVKMKRLLGLTLVLALLLTIFSGCTGSDTVATAPSDQEAGTSDSEASASADSEASSAPSGAPTVDMDKVYTIKLTSADPITTIWMQAMKKACEQVFIHTDSKVDIQMYPSGEMLVNDEGVEAVMSDTAVFYFTGPTMFADYVPAYKTLGAPYLFSSHTEAEKFMESDLMKEINQDANAAGLHAVSTSFVVGCRNTLATKPINNVEDFVGLKIRVPGASIYADTFGALEASYTPMAFSDTFSAIQTGVLDAVEVTPGNAVSTKMWEAMDTAYYSMTKHILNVVGLFTGEGYWQSLPEEYRDIIEEEFGKAALAANQEVADSDASLIQEMVDAGVELVEIADLSEFKNKVEPVCKTFEKYDEIVSTIEGLS